MKYNYIKTLSIFKIKNILLKQSYFIWITYTFFIYCLILQKQHFKIGLLILTILF